MVTSRLVPSAVLCAVLATGATACGAQKDKPGTAAKAPAASASQASSPSAVPTLATDTLSADQILTQSQAAMAKLTALKLEGSVTTDGTKIAMSISSDKQGNCIGTVDMGSQGLIEVRHTGTQTWLKPDAAFWKALAAKKGKPQMGAAMAELFKGRFLTGGQNDADLKGINEEFCGMAQHAADNSGNPKAVKGTAGTVNGIKTFSLDLTEDDGTHSTGYVATEGQPYLVRIESNGSEPGQLTFSEYDKPVVVPAPPADEVIDFSVFEQKLKTA